MSRQLNIPPPLNTHFLLHCRPDGATEDSEPQERFGHIQPLAPLHQSASGHLDHARGPLDHTLRGRFLIILRDEQLPGPLKRITWQGQMLTVMNTPDRLSMPGYMHIHAAEMHQSSDQRRRASV